MAAGNCRAIATAALLLIAVAANVEGMCRELECPEANGYFAHPKTCLQYVKCVDGKAFTEKCPANLHFNSGTGMCDTPANSNCVEAEKEKSLSCSLGRRSMTRSAPVAGIPCDCGKCCRKPDPTDCTKFFECDEDGNAYSKTCSSGLVYNPVEEECDLPSNYECPKPVLCQCKCRYPVDGECDAFHRCEEVGQVATKEYCTEGLVFNAETEMCDFPANTDCPAPEPPTCKDSKSDCKFWAANGDCVCDPDKSGDCSWQHHVKNSCPFSCNTEKCGGDGGDVTTPGPVIEGCLSNCKLGNYYRHPTDCTRFIQCAPYGPADMPCGAGTRWDQDLLTCNHASMTPCVTGDYKNADGSDCEDLPPAPTNPPVTNPPVTSPPEGIIDGCVINCKLDEYYRHPTDCTKFIQCAPYGPAEMPCAAGTRWDQDLLTCNHASATDCVTGTYLDTEGKECGGEGNGGGNQDCEIDCSKGQYHRHPSDCTKFIQCTPYGPQEMPCAAGTRWDQSILTCNHESVTPCVTGNGVCVTTPSVKPPVCDVTCPKPYGEFGHPTDCKKWVHCSHNIPYVKDCPAELHFDITKRVCNWPNDAVCLVNELQGSCEIPIPPEPTDGPNPPPVPVVCDCECCLRPHPDDCQSYYYCDGAHFEFFTCGEGLVFDPEKETCVRNSDYPLCNPIPEPVCECDCHYPSPICSEYFICQDEKPVRYECSGGLHYNPNTFACDHPENVQCVDQPTRRSAGRMPAYIEAKDCTRLPNGHYPIRSRPEAMYHCHNGVAFMLKCKEGTTFSPVDGKCARK